MACFKSRGGLIQIAAPAIKAKPLNRRTVMESRGSFRNLRCADGDLAIVINDLHQCRSNIGKLVHVRGPARTLTLPQLPGWHIKPVDRRLWAVQQKDGTFARELVSWSSKVYHEDAWLLPIKLVDD